MIYYSTSDNHREKLYFWMAVISTGLSSLLLTFDNDLIHKVIVPSGFLIYAGIIFLFDEYLWKLKPFSLLTKLPNLNGKYKGVNTIINGKTEQLDITINQTWRKIDVIVRTGNTISNVITANFNTENNDCKVLNYIWSIRTTQPLANFNHSGEGKTELRINIQNGTFTIDGNYFSSKLSAGSFTLERI